MKSSDIDLNDIINTEEYRGSIVREKEKENALDRHIRIVRFYATLIFSGMAFITVFVGLCYIYVTTDDTTARGWIQSILLSTFVGSALALGIQVTASTKD